MSGATTTAAASPPLIPSLPDDVAVNIIARVPRSNHPTLSLVSKSFRSLVSSSLLFSTRRLVGVTQPALYLYLRRHHHRHPSSPAYIWFTLHPTRRQLIPIPSSSSSFCPPSIGSAYAVLGPFIYAIGGSLNDVASPRVWILDCRFHTWAPGPSMRVGREFAAAGVVGGRLYVVGGCTIDTWARSTNWAEVLDPKAGEGAGAWETVPSSSVAVKEKWMHASAVAGGRVYAMADRGGVVYDVDKGIWEGVETELDLGWRGRACVIDGVLYCYDYLGKIRGFEFETGAWKELKGVEKGLPRFLCGATMANFGRNLIVVWEEKQGGKEMEIWCAEIALKKDENAELVGEVLWLDSVLKVPEGSSIVTCLTVAL